jgi:hypothetical protein
MAGGRPPLLALAADGRLRREALALALFRLAEFGPWVTIWGQVFFVPPATDPDG